MPVATRTLTIEAPEGLHARPATAVAKAATESGAKVTVAAGERPAVNASSVLMIMALGVKKGDVVTLTVDGADPEVLADRLSGVLLEH